jgi:hypothetical protein
MMHPGMAARTDRNQKVAIVEPGLTMVDLQAIPCPAGPAMKTVAFQNVVPQAGKAETGPGAGGVAGAAQPPNPGSTTAARAEEGFLDQGEE